MVEPPTAMTTAIAFSKAGRVRIRRGRRSRAIASASAWPARSAACAVSGSSAAIVDVWGRLIPSASIADDMVLAVNMPPQEPAPGHARRSISRSSSSPIFPALILPTASKTLTIVRPCPS